MCPPPLLLCRCGHVVLELVLPCVQGFEAFLLLLFSCLFLVFLHYLFVFSDRSWVDLVWLPLPPSPSSLLICWCFLCRWFSSSRRNPGVPNFYPLFFFMVDLLRAMGVRAEPSLIRTLPGACSLSSLRDEVRTVPMGGRVERGLELLLQGNSPKCPRGSFSFGEKSSCSILWLPLYKEGRVLSHSRPLQLGWGLSRSGS